MHGRAMGAAVLTTLLVTFLSPVPTAARVAARTAVELSLVAGYSNRDDSVSGLQGSQKCAAGFEYFAKLSGDRGDYATTDVQLRLSYDSRQEGDDAFAFEVHNAWLEYRLGLGRKLRFGHFTQAHGLEPVRDTHGTLVQTLAPLDVGFKKDWGIGYSGTAGPLDLDVALQTGTGMAPAPGDGSYLVSAQTWSPSGMETRYALSVLHGEVRTGGQMRTLPLPDYTDGTTTRTRVGAALERLAGSFTLLAEASVGRDNASPVGGLLAEVDYVPPSAQRLTIELQLRAWDNDLDSSGGTITAAHAGASYLLTDALTLRGALTVVGRDGQDETQATIQLYYYGG